MNKQIIYSKEYEQLNWDDWDSRHNLYMQKKYGVWRWKGIYENHNLIVGEMIFRRKINKKQGTYDYFKDKKRIIDLGGALAPLGFNSEIIDCLDADILGNKVKYKKLEEYPGQADVIFSSHYMEHKKYIIAELFLCKEKLKDDGILIIHSPSIEGAEYWHPDVKEEHHWLFALKQTPIEDIKKTIYLDAIMERWFNIEFAEYVGDCSLLIIGRKK